MSTILLTGTYALVTCYKADCGMTFAVAAQWQRDRRGDHETFYCPNGHPQSYRGQSEAERLQDELETERRRTQLAHEATERAARRAVAAEHSRRVTKGHLTRIKRRVGAGVCPCCRRTVKQLAAHMRSKHPGFGKGDGA